MVGGLKTQNLWSLEMDWNLSLAEIYLKSLEYQSLKLFVLMKTRRRSHPKNCYQKIIGEIIEVTRKSRRTCARPLMTSSLANGLRVTMNLAFCAQQKLTALYLSRSIQCNSILPARNTRINGPKRILTDSMKCGPRFGCAENRSIYVRNPWTWETGGHCEKQRHC